MRVNPFFVLPLLVCLPATPAHAAPPACRMAIVEGEVDAGQPFHRDLGGGLVLALQPIASGWIVRVLPAAGPLPLHDYAELATPPYRSVTPLSLSTDFAFRAQDAVAWNPRRFRFATSQPAYVRLEELYTRLEQAGATPPAPLTVELSHEIAQSAEATLSIVDARLIAGTADQWKMAAVVASHFHSTAHTLVDPPDGHATALGRLLWVRFRVELALPPGFAMDRKLQSVPRACGAG